VSRFPFARCAAAGIDSSTILLCGVTGRRRGVLVVVGMFVVLVIVLMRIVVSDVVLLVRVIVIVHGRLVVPTLGHAASGVFRMRVVVSGVTVKIVFVREVIAVHCFGLLLMYAAHAGWICHAMKNIYAATAPASPEVAARQNRTCRSALSYQRRVQ
jgi:hypothetical protein